MNEKARQIGEKLFDTNIIQYNELQINNKMTKKNTLKV